MTSLSLAEAVQAYNEAVKSGVTKDINSAKRTLDKVRHETARTETRSEEELMHMFRDAIRRDCIAEAMQYYYSAQAVKKSGKHENSIMDEIINNSSGDIYN